ncbi:MAG: 3-phosphoshikimate 1-carboxyvinyltransferase [Pseudomonadota bacterium]|nr:3-phosphoshikimate 1-carboxyvinyltransferase [Pseudomonadota bacterium]MEC8497938.1 3-phosphoshikimate 1-carboxyvinyltransferase [Pseudomonadota bacterium]
MSAKPLLTMNQDQKNKTLSSKFFSSKSSDLNGEITIPGDKSISHRCVILSSLAIGESKINGLLNSSDVNCTINAMKSFGASIDMSSNDECTVNGIGIGSLKQPDNPLDFGNSGTAVRLMLGLVSTYPIETHFTGDESLTQRPMRRVTDPLTDFGANFELRNKEFLPIVVKGANLPIPITYEMEVASAQVKSAILLAGLNTPGITTVVEKEKTRDHTETLLKYYGYEISQEERNNKNFISLEGQKFLSPVNIKVPGDPSSAAYPVVAGLICKNSNIKIKNVLLNPTRDGLYRCLDEMGAKITYSNKRNEAGEITYDLEVKSSSLKPIDVPADRAPSMIDDYPILAVAASLTNGISIFRGLSELKVKESDRLLGIYNFLSKNGIEAKIDSNNLIINGSSKGPKGGGLVETNLDHRIAMSSIILGMVSDESIRIDDIETIKTSFPNFIELMKKLGARISV